MMFTDTEIADAVERRWTERFEQFLDQVPFLIEFLRAHMIPLQAASLAERVTGGGGEAPLPFRVDPVDATDDLWGALVDYTGEVAERLQLPLPHSCSDVWRANGATKGIPAQLGISGARRASFTIIGWLIDRAPRILPLDLIDSERYLFDLIRSLEARYLIPPEDRPLRRRRCLREIKENPGTYRGCGEYAVVVDWILGGTGEGKCLVCGEVFAPEGNEN